MGTSSSTRWTADPGRIWSVWLPLAAAAAFWLTEARYGYNPTDDGFILAQGWRVAHLEIPHVDFTSPRPLGSALLHAPESLLPLGTLAFSRMVVVLQLLWIAVASVRLMSDRRLRLTGIQGFVLVMIAFILNASSWPIMAWHTIDGLFLGLTALWLSQRESPASGWRHAQWVSVWLLAGSAPLMKQGFAVIPLLLAVLLWATHRVWGLVYVPVVLIPGALYLTITRDTPGGLRNQLYSGTLAEALQPTQDFLGALLSSNGLIAVIAVVIAFALARWAPAGSWFIVLTTTALVALPVLWAAFEEKAWYAGDWPWIAAIVLVTATVLSVPMLESAVKALCIILLAYATALSWGVTTPGLMAGTMVSAAMILVAAQYLAHQSEAVTPPAGFLVAAVGVLVLGTLLILPARAASPYRDVPRSAMSASVDEPRFALIQMSPQTAAYVNEVRRCLARYPASKVAVLPDDPGQYPLLGVRNPFHSDRWVAAERAGDHEERVAATVAELNASDDWIVLFQSFDLALLPTLSPDQVTAAGEPFAYSSDDLALLESLSGQPLRCGSLSGVYRPPGASGD